MKTHVEGAPIGAGALQEALTREREAHAETRAELLDELARTRGDFLRLLNEETSMLEDALSAAGRTPPKTAVVVDHIERVVERLKARRESLRAARRRGRTPEAAA